MKILAIYNFHRTGSACGDDQVFKSEAVLLEEHDYKVIKYTVSNDEFDSRGLFGKITSILDMLYVKPEKMYQKALAANNWQKVVKAA